MEKEVVSSSESEEEKQDKSVTVAYKSTRSAVSLSDVYSVAVVFSYDFYYGKH